MVSPRYTFCALLFCLIGRCSGVLPRPEHRTLLRGGSPGGRRWRGLRPVGSCSWVQTIRGWNLCVALSRAICFLTVPGPTLLPHDDMMYDEFNSDVDVVIKTVALYTLLYLFISMFSLSHVSFTCCRESGSDTSACVVRWWLLMCF